MAKGRSVTLGSKADDQLKLVNEALEREGCGTIRMSETLRVALRLLSSMPESKIKAAVENNRKMEFTNQ